MELKLYTPTLDFLFILFYFYFSLVIYIYLLLAAHWTISLSFISVLWDSHLEFLFLPPSYVPLYFHFFFFFGFLHWCLSLISFPHCCSLEPFPNPWCHLSAISLQILGFLSRPPQYMCFQSELNPTLSCIATHIHKTASPG